MRRHVVLAAVFALVVATAGPSDAGHDGGAGPYVATVKTNSGYYRAVVRDPEMIAKARAEATRRGDAGVPIGRLAWGDGGVNHGHVWHVVELGFADFTIELCDATVREVDRNPAYWVETVGSFCPWSGQVVALTRLRARR